MATFGRCLGAIDLSFIVVDILGHEVVPNGFQGIINLLLIHAAGMERLRSIVTNKPFRKTYVLEWDISTPMLLFSKSTMLSPS
jgi:hypothetical protein